MKTFRDQVIDLRDWCFRQARSYDDLAHDMSKYTDQERTGFWIKAESMYLMEKKLNKILGDI